MYDVFKKPPLEIRKEVLEKAKEKSNPKQKVVFRIVSNGYIVFPLEMKELFISEHTYLGDFLKDGQRFGVVLIKVYY